MSKPLAVIIDKVVAPWSEEQCLVLNRLQHDDRLHPYTCPGERQFCRGDDGRRRLRATPHGWICRCGRYRQDWAVITTNL